MSKSRQYAIVHTMPTQTPKPSPDQFQKFQDLARELEADEDEAAFEEQVKKVAVSSSKPPKERSDSTGE